MFRPQPQRGRGAPARPAAMEGSLWMGGEGGSGGAGLTFRAQTQFQICILVLLFNLLVTDRLQQAEKKTDLDF